MVIFVKIFFFAVFILRIAFYFFSEPKRSFYGFLKKFYNGGFQFGEKNRFFDGGFVEEVEN